MMVKNIVLTAASVMILSVAGYTQAKKANSESKEKKTETPYVKLFKDKRVKTEKGMITLHKMDGKVYFEFPVNLLNREMLLGSVAESVSNSDHAVAGEQANDPLCIYFTQIDSTVHIRRATFDLRADKDDLNLENALRKNNTGAILASFKILAVSPDSSSVVFDATSFFVSGNTEMDAFMPVGGLYSRKTSYKSDNSLLGDVMAYEDNVSITSYLSYGVTSTFFGFYYEEDRPSTVLIKRSLVLLPEDPMRPRFNDPRIGVFYTAYMKFSGKDNGMKPVYYANRWRLEPKDVAAHKRGELVDPVKPVLFYIDDKFPVQWIKYIKQGVEDWNKAYEQIGFKNVIVTRMYPKNDPSFDPNNIKYNCIKYAPTSTQNAMGPSWVDPRTGEILNASIYIYHGIADILNEWMFLQTAAADKRARTMEMPEELMGKAIRYVAAHEMGHCLGLMHNMGASSSFPVDSLRSPTFTSKYGTTPSIMDYARFNFVAQPGDFEKGVKMTPPDLGVYDYYAIKWLYEPVYSAGSPEQEVPVLEKLIADKIKDPMYRYGKQQLNGTLDPNAQTEDLGDDQVKATRYALENLKYVIKNMNEWVKDEDVDYSFRRKTNFAIINIQFYWYLTHVLCNIGGIYQYEKYEGDPFPAYRAVPRETQKESVRFLLDVLENLSWLNNPELEENMDNINGDASEYMRSVLFPYMMRWVAAIGFSESKADANPYTQAECIADVFDYVWGSTIEGKVPTKEKLSMQTILVQLLIRNSQVMENPAARASALNGLHEEEVAILKLEALAAGHNILHPGHHPMAARDQFNNNGDIEGFGYLPRIKYQTEDVAHVYYAWLLESKGILEKAVKKHKGDIKTRYQYLLLQINKALKV